MDPSRKPITTRVRAFFWHTGRMLIQLLSDLHLEVAPEFSPHPAPAADVLVLAGDIGAAPNSPMGQHGTPDWGLRRFSPQLGNWPVPVLYIPGNHEYDGQEFMDCRAALRATAEALGITWLEQEAVVLAGVRFVGTTLWSDFDAITARCKRVFNTGYESGDYHQSNEIDGKFPN